MDTTLDEIAELYYEGYTPATIAEIMGMAQADVDAMLEQRWPDTGDEQYNDQMDGDEASALASAGWGTDEDYGSASECW